MRGPLIVPYLRSQGSDTGPGVYQERGQISHSHNRLPQPRQLPQPLMLTGRLPTAARRNKLLSKTLPGYS